MNTWKSFDELPPYYVPILVTDMAPGTFLSGEAQIGSYAEKLRWIPTSQDELTVNDTQCGGYFGVEITPTMRWQLIILPTD